MIQVIIKEKGKDIDGFEVLGHADSAERGKDIVCAAVSVLTINTINTLTELVKVDKNINFEILEEGTYLDLDEDFPEEYRDHTQLVLRSFELGIKSILSGNQDYIQLYYREV